MPLRHAGDGENPPWDLPLRAPSKKKTKQAGGGGGGGGGGSKENSKKSSKKSSKKGGDGGAGGVDGDDDESIARMGMWEELFDAVNGTKVWYNTVTRKKTNKDPFW